MFEFITSSHPDDCKAEATQKRIREHAIRKGLKAKREKCANEEGRDTQMSVPDGQPSRLQIRAHRNSLRLPHSLSLVDPFQSLCERPDRLAAFLKHPLIYRAGEPVFRVTDDGIIHFQGMESLERGLWAEPLLFYALSLAAALAVNRDYGNAETLRYRGLLLRELHTTILKPNLRSNESFAAALLVLIGSEYRTKGSDKRTVDRHLRGMHAVLVANPTSTSFPRLRLLQRALFWQDLISCLTIDTPRLLSHMTPSDCRYLNSTHSNAPQVECGFRASGLVYHQGFWVIIEDIRNLCHIVDAHCSSKVSIPLDREVHLLEELDDEGYPIDNAQANIESRVVDLLHQARQHSTANSTLYQACLYAAYLCTYKLSAGLWAGQFVPEICASRILDHVEDFMLEGVSTSSTNLLIWLLSMSGGLTERGETRSRALKLLKHPHLGSCQRFLPSWSEVTAVLSTMIWCQPAMEKDVSRLWAQLFT